MNRRQHPDASATRPRLPAALWTYVLLLVWASATLLIAPVPPAQAQIAAKAEGEALVRFGRLVLTFDHLPKYKVRLNTSVFVLEFDEPVSVDVSKLTDQLETYVAAARGDPDGRAIRLALAQVLTVNTMEAGDQLFIDFLPQGWTGLPPGLPEHVVAALAQRAKEAEDAAKLQALRDAGLVDVPEVRVEVGQNPTFTRLAFFWDRNVDASLTRDRKDVTITFNKQGNVNLTDARAALPNYIEKIDSELTNDSLILRLSVDRTSGVRAFSEDKTYYVDVSAGMEVLSGDANLRSLVPDVAGDGAAPDNAQLATELPGAKPPDQQQPVRENTPPAEPVSVGMVPFDPQTLAPAEFADWSTLPPRAGSTAPSATGPGNGVRVGDLGAAGEQPKQSVTPDSEDPGPAEHVRVEAQRVGQSIRLVFPFHKKVPAAVFNRMGTVWMVFDSDLPIEIEHLKNELSDRATGIEVMRSGDLQVIRLKLAKPELTTAAAEASLWVVTIGDLVLEPSKPLALRRGLGNDGQGIVLVDMPNVGRVHWVRDPDIGDMIAVVTAFGPPRGLVKPQDFVEFAAFASSHGLALRPIADDLRVSLRINEILITRSDGLSLSAGGAQQYAPGRQETGNTRRPGYIDFAGISRTGASKFLDSKQQLEREAALAKPSESAPLKMILARFYIGHHLAAEALGVLDILAETDSGIVEDPSFNALRGIANILMGRKQEARKDLTVHGLSQSRDVQLWRGIMEADSRNWRAAQLAIREGEAVLAEYPEQMQAKFRLTAARAALEVKDLADASYHLGALPQITNDPDLAAQALLINARYEESLGRMQDALNLYDRAIATEVRPTVAEATLRKIELQNRLGTLPTKDALEQLETLAVVWRGDDIELGTMKMLAKLNVEVGDYRRAFETMRTASLLQPDAEITRHIQDEMATVFQDLFLNGKADNLPAIDALSLYYDYRDLTPVGRHGDEMIRKLADRLVEVDLLDQAADLLTHQIDNRLRGAARAQVATRLAMIHLMNHQPARALSVLQRTRVSVLPADLQQQRNTLEARALAETGRIDLSLELLDSMTGPDIERLRADVLWQGHRWQELAEVLERSLAGAWEGPDPLSDEQRYEIMRAAIGYSLAEDQLGLDRLRTKFARKMSESLDAQAFEVVTRPIKARGEEFLDLAKRIASIDTLEAFLTEFRKTYKTPSGDVDTPPPS